MTETHTPYQLGRRAAERGADRYAPLDLFGKHDDDAKKRGRNHFSSTLSWLEGYDSVPIIPPSVGIRVVQLPHAAGLPLPEYATAGAAGMDLLAAVSCALPPIKSGVPVLVRTGLMIAVPTGHELQIRPRSGLALKHAITVLNSPGTIDEDYRGEIGVIMMNMGRTTYEVKRGQRIAQAVIAPVTRAHWVPADTLDDTARGCSGFGSTGV